MPRIMWGVANPKLVTHSPANKIEPYGHSTDREFLVVSGSSQVTQILSQQTSLLGIRAGLTATRKRVCSGSRNTIYEPREMWVVGQTGSCWRNPCWSVVNPRKGESREATSRSRVKLTRAVLCTMLLHICSSGRTRIIAEGCWGVFGSNRPISYCSIMSGL
jgi:hypothetical protein